MLSVAPFPLPGLSELYGVGLGLASFATAAQLLGFVVGSWGPVASSAPGDGSSAGARRVHRGARLER